MKIHHTNRTMNATFNLKRFLLLEQYKRNETGRHLLWSAAVVSFICILCILYDINRGGSYYGKHTSATEFSRYVLWFILMAPCLLETNFSKRSSTLDILLPASAFEKFLHIWIKYLLLLPLFCGLLIACLKGLLSLSGSEFLQYFATHITMFRIHNTQILTNAILHASAFIGYFAFSRQVLLKSFTIFVGSIAVCIGIVTFVASLMPEARADGYWMDNIATWPHTNIHCRRCTSHRDFLQLCGSHQCAARFMGIELLPAQRKTTVAYGLQDQQADIPADCRLLFQQDSHPRMAGRRAGGIREGALHTTGSELAHRAEGL